MKKFIVLTILTLQVTLMFAQNGQQRISISHYVFPEFIEGKVLKKQGGSNNVLLNYNTLTREMIFDQNGYRFALAELNNIDTVYLINRKFVPVDSGFYEVIPTRSNISLYINHISKVSVPGVSDGYGSTSNASSAVALSSLVNTAGGSNPGGRAIYNLKLPDEYKVIPKVEFYLKTENGFIKINGLKQVMKALPDRAQGIKKYADDTHSKLNNQKSLVDLFNSI